MCRSQNNVDDEKRKCSLFNMLGDSGITREARKRSVHRLPCPPTNLKCIKADVPSSDSANEPEEFCTTLLKFEVSMSEYTEAYLIPEPVIL